MVSTRRSTANAAPTTNGTTRFKRVNLEADTVHVLNRHESSMKNPPTTPELQRTQLGALWSRSISEHNLTLASPTTSETAIMSTIEEGQTPPGRAEPAPTSALRKLAPKPPGSSAQHPILMIEDSPPHPKWDPIQKHQRELEPHKFMDRGYKDLYKYQPSRAALAPKPANGNTFTGHKSHDLYRMINAKTAASTGNNIDGMYKQASLSAPFEVEYPISAQFLAQHNRVANRPLSVYTQPYAVHLRPKPLTTVPAPNEEFLRKKAVQYVREYSRLTQRKRSLSNVDPDETSTSESEQQPSTVTQSSAMKQRPRLNNMNTSSPSKSGLTSVTTSRKLGVYKDPEQDFQLVHLTEHTQLLASLLQIYPTSKDQKGLREDISMLVSVQNQRVTDWMKTEHQAARKRRKSNKSSTVSVSSGVPGRHAAQLTKITAEKKLEYEKIAAERERKKGRDDEMRQLLSAEANMWQDGSGQGVADVFAVTPSSTSTKSEGAMSLRSIDQMASTSPTLSNHEKTPNLTNSHHVLSAMEKLNSARDHDDDKPSNTEEVLSDTASTISLLEDDTAAPETLPPSPGCKFSDLLSVTRAESERLNITNKRLAVVDKVASPIATADEG